jgi:hypothetical protein
VTAVAAGKTDVAEVSRIMAENIAHWAGVELDHTQIYLLWRLIYNVEALDTEQLASGYDLFSRVQRDFIGRNHFAAGRGNRIFNRQARVIFVKRIFDCIDRKDILDLRAVTRLYMGRHGSFDLFVFVWVFSYVPFVLFVIPVFYLKYRKFMTRRFG